MYQVRRADERGKADHGWLKASHTFSFGSYQDPNFRGFRSLRVMNHDQIAADAGFATHPHKDMEIVTYVIAGAIAHKDSMGNSSTIKPGEIQRMSAGSGVTHSEYNPLSDQPTELYQIWIEPDTLGLEPSYEQKDVAATQETNNWQLIAAPNPSGSAVRIHQDVKVFRSILADQQSLAYDIAPGRGVWLQVIKGEVSCGGHTLNTADGLAVDGERKLSITASAESELLLFDLA